MSTTNNILDNEERTASLTTNPLKWNGQTENNILKHLNQNPRYAFLVVCCQSLCNNMD